MEETVPVTSYVVYVESTFAVDSPSFVAGFTGMGTSHVSSLRSQSWFKR
jgi:hypothetical protein